MATATQKAEGATIREGAEEMEGTEEVQDENGWRDGQATSLACWKDVRLVLSLHPPRDVRSSLTSLQHPVIGWTPQEKALANPMARLRPMRKKRRIGRLANERSPFACFQIGSIQARLESFKWSLLIGQLFTFWPTGLAFSGCFCSRILLIFKDSGGPGFWEFCKAFYYDFSLPAVGTTAFLVVGIYYVTARDSPLRVYSLSF